MIKAPRDPGGYALDWVIRVRAAGQGMVFWPRCPKQGIQFNLPLSYTGLKPVLNKVWYYEPRDFKPLSFLRLRPGPCEKLKELAIERRTRDVFLFWICTTSTKKRLLRGHYNVINQHQIIFWTRILLLSVSWFKIFFHLLVLYQARIDTTDRTGTVTY